MRPWWQGRPLRIFHPNPAESEVAGMDVDGFIEDCVSANAEAVVVSTGGIFAFYPSEVPYHYVSPVIGDRDLIGEITAAARARDLRVIARVDFSKARADVYAEHPEWFVRRPDGSPGRRGDYYLTCPMSGYQNEAFAHLVLEEILTSYDVDGFHLNAGGFHGLCTCKACANAFGRPIPTGPEEGPDLWRHYLRWRRQALAAQFKGLYDVMKRIKPDVFFMSELAGQEYAEWARNNGYYLPALTDAFSQILVSSGGVRHARESRWWVGMSADKVRAAGSRCLINIKIHMRDLNINQTVMPPSEFAFWGYQALAHGAGLKLPTFGIPATLADPRAMPAIGELLGFMERRQSLLDTMTPLSQVGLVWPDRTLLHADDPDAVDADGLQAEFAGLYTALKANHVQFHLIYEALLTGDALKDLEALILPTPFALDEDQAEAVVAMASRGGRVVLLDAVSGSDFPPLPRALAEVLPIEDQGASDRTSYAVSLDGAPKPLRARGPLPLLQPYRVCSPGPDTEVWLWAARCGEMGIPEDADALKPADNPILLRVPVGEGDIVYATGGLGQTVMELGHPDHTALLGDMLFEAGGIDPLLDTDAPSCIDVVLARWRGGLVVHLVNAAGPAPLDGPVPVGPIALDVPWSGPARCTWIAPGEPPASLEAAQVGNRLRITVPSVRIYGQVVIEGE
ncbi:MAG: hypothetical protein ACP5JG_07830 [Anaerolineae bacterium]